MGKSASAPERIAGWLLAGARPADYQAELDPNVFHTGSRSCRVSCRNEKAASWGTFMQTFSAKEYLGKRLQMTFWLRTEGIKEASGWLRVDGTKSEVLAFENMCNRATTGTKGWEEHSIVLDVPNDATQIAFGAIIKGTGTMWLDDFSFETVGEDVEVTSCPCSPKAPEASGRNLNFESD